LNGVPSAAARPEWLSAFLVPTVAFAFYSTERKPDEAFIEPILSLSASNQIRPLQFEGHSISVRLWRQTTLRSTVARWQFRNSDDVPSIAVMRLDG
jgi:hypothetical protein